MISRGPVEGYISMKEGAACTPAVLEHSSFEYHLQEYIRQFQPVGHLESMVVRDLGRQTAAMEVWGEGVAALQRQRAQRLPELVLLEGAGDDELEDVSLAAAVSAPDVQLGELHGQRRTRAFYRALRTLDELQARRNGREAEECQIPPTSRFLTEAACQAYLLKRFEQGCYRCLRCGCGRGHFISSRRCWECSGCKRQTGLRTGTVAADSPLPLVTWFEAIRLLFWRPTIGTTELGIKLGISRSTTVRNMARKICAAMTERNGSELLAGLDMYYARSWTTPPESGAREDKKVDLGPTGIRSSSGAHANPFGMES